MQNIVIKTKLERGLEYLIRYYQSYECGLFRPQPVTTSIVTREREVYDSNFIEIAMRYVHMLCYTDKFI